jgi:hypothetical protein
MSARELFETLQHRTQEVKDFMASMVVDHLDGVVGDAEWEKLTEQQADGADSIWGLA